ncbi:MAG TPA: hypothetical protein VD902_12540, partial [Symbiobacteriaceae bacterium]|nr:hypothetical protein [Symbiobacteriaceae bacterium]
ADVWFRLQTANFTCQHWQLRIANRECWELTVLNRGERSDFFFLEGTGPVKAQVTNWAKPQASFVKQAQAVETALPAGAERAAYLPGGLASPPPEAPFTVVTFSDFDQALVAAVRAAGRPITELDLDGDGAKELVLGPLGQWTTEPVEFIRTGAGSPLPPLANWATSARHRVTPYPVDGGKKTWFLHERHLPELGHSLITLEQGGFMEVWGWAPKASRTEGTEVSFRPDGTIVVVWDMGDPARHRWIREYKLDTTRDDWPYLQSVSSRFVPQEGELRYPATPQEVLQAAFVAFWLGFDDELPRYFAAPNVAEPLTTNTKAERAMYGPGTVELGTVTFKEITGFGADPVQRPEITPSPVGPDGTVGFLARLGGYEHTNYVWGKVTFGIDPAGRPVIVRLEVEGAVSLF